MCVEGSLLLSGEKSEPEAGGYTMSSAEGPGSHLGPDSVVQCLHTYCSFTQRCSSPCCSGLVSGSFSGFSAERSSLAPDLKQPLHLPLPSPTHCLL